MGCREFQENALYNEQSILYLMWIILRIRFTSLFGTEPQHS